MLGPLEAFADGTDVTPTSPNQRTVLAVLAAHPGQHVRTDTLIDALWGHDPPPTAERTLRSYVSRLRAAVGSRIVASRGGFCLDTSDIRLDSIEFERLVASAKPLAPAAAADTLRSALALWHGPAFGEFAELDTVCAQARALEQLRIGAREQLAAALQKAGDFAAAGAEAEALLAELPLDEGAWEILIRALSGGGRTAEALEAYRRAYDTLSAVGLEPSERLRQAQRDAFDAKPAAPPRPVVVTPNEGLVGRDDDLAALARLVDRCNLVTVVGPGGVGKTTLAREVARRRAPSHSGGVRVVELAAVTDASAVPDVVVTALGLTSDGGAPLTALRRVRSMDLVVLLDNCEHVLDAVCDVLQAVLPSEPSPLRVVATSRELLGMPGEHAWPLAPLDCSGPDSPAQRFFARQADAVRPGTVTASDSAAVTTIVRRLDGLPLAIELAAAQVAALGIEDLAEQIDSSLEAQLGGLARRGGEPRHRTLRAAIEWSERLLPHDAREALVDWTVFAGAVRRSDAQAVLQVAPDVIDELARRSLLSVEVRSGRTYYTMLKTVRSAVGPPSEDAERRHLKHFAAAAEQAATALRTAEEPAAHRRIVELIDELRLAHTRARSIDVETSVQMSTALHWFGVSRLHTEVLGWAAKLQPLVADRPDLRAAVDSSVAYLHVIAEQLDVAHRLADGALADASDDQTRCRALEVLADCALFTGDLEAARSWSSELVTVARRARDVYYEAVGRYVVVMSLAYGGEHDAARKHRVELDRRFAKGAVSPTLQSWLAYLKGETVLDADPATASAAFTRAIELADSAGSTYVGGVARVSAITLRSRTAATPDVLPLYVDVIERWLDAGSWSYLLTTMRNLVPTLTELGEYVAAVQALGAVTRPEQTPTYGRERERLASAEDMLRAKLSAADFAHHCAVGSARDLAAAARAAVTAIMRAHLRIEAGPAVW
ncbi:BTAD domain-containing putative transcriptional regulator [Mycobacterium sp. 3519A]|uniref:BTAD domain-containing putative transcriptional regulator n=1 Tax=Mycobacterium sp. 3519A TaxID=2057184 RepID=UPI00135A5197|nr:BTAD domain-containing putative transcriptional regulator [Mycobacterium sp. 3519A]